MKKKLVFLFIVTFCISFAQTPLGYKKIPTILDTTDYLYPFIKPDKKYGYWSVFRNIRNIDDAEKAIIYESEMPNYMTINEPFPAHGFFQQCEGANCFSFIVACKNNKPEYFATERQLRDFIGSVDNLPEALLVAKTYGFSFDSKDKLGGLYAIEKDYFLMFLVKPNNNSGNMESFFIKINRKNGKLEAKSNGV